jgi:hypothetical protein
MSWFLVDGRWIGRVSNSPYHFMGWKESLVWFDVADGVHVCSMCVVCVRRDRQEYL